LQLQILFDDSLTETYEYPSEQSLMAATPAQPGDVDYEGELVHSTGLLVTPSIVAAGQFWLEFCFLTALNCGGTNLLLIVSLCQCFSTFSLKRNPFQQF